MTATDPPVVLVERTEQRSRLLIAHPRRVRDGDVLCGSEDLVGDEGVCFLRTVAGLSNPEMRPYEAVVNWDTPRQEQMKHLGCERILAPWSAERPALLNKCNNPLDGVDFTTDWRCLNGFKQLR